MTSSILKSIFITATAFITAVCIAVIAASYTICYEGIERELEAECREFSDGYAAHGMQSIEMKSGTDGLLFIGGNGEILFGTGSTDTEEISEARNRGVGFCVGERGGRKILYCAVEDSAGNIIRLCADIGSGMSPFFDTLYFTLISLIFSVTAAFFVAFWLSHGIVKPLRDFDIDRPRADSRYPELKPLIDKLNLQRYKISEQMT